MGVLFVGRASLARKRTAAGHIGKKLQFPRTRRSRDRIAERAPRGGGLRSLRPVIILAPTSRTRAFCRASVVAPTSRARAFCRANEPVELNSKKHCSGPCWKKASRGTPVIGLRAIRGGVLEICALSSSLRQLLARVLLVRRASLARKRIAGHSGKKPQFPRARHSRDRIAERARRRGGLRNFSCHQSLRQLPDVLFVGQASLNGKRIAAGHIGKKLQFPRARHSRDRIAERAIKGGGLEIIVALTSRRAFI